MIFKFLFNPSMSLLEKLEYLKHMNPTRKRGVLWNVKS
jgi:hypothetical protein